MWVRVSEWISFVVFSFVGIFLFFSAGHDLVFTGSFQLREYYLVVLHLYNSSYFIILKFC